MKSSDEIGTLLICQFIDTLVILWKQRKGKNIFYFPRSSASVFSWTYISKNQLNILLLGVVSSAAICERKLLFYSQWQKLSLPSKHREAAKHLQSPYKRASSRLYPIFKTLQTVILEGRVGFYKESELNVISFTNGTKKLI